MHLGLKEQMITYCNKTYEFSLLYLLSEACSPHFSSLGLKLMLGVNPFLYSK